MLPARSVAPVLADPWELGGPLWWHTMVEEGGTWSDVGGAPDPVLDGAHDGVPAWVDALDDPASAPYVIDPEGALLTDPDHQLDTLLAARTGPESAAVLALVDLATVDVTDLPALAVAAGRLEAWAHAVSARIAGELADRPLMNPAWPTHVGRVARPCIAADELALRLNLGRRSAEALVDEGTAYRTCLPRTGEALRDGRIDRARARVMVQRLREVDPVTASEVEARVLPGAGDRTAAQLRQDVDRALLVVDPAEDALRRARSRTGRHVTHPRALPDGMAGMWAVLPAPDAARLDGALDASAHALRRAGDERSVAQLRVDALLDAGLAGTGMVGTGMVGTGTAGTCMAVMGPVGIGPVGTGTAVPGAAGASTIWVDHIGVAPVGPGSSVGGPGAPGARSGSDGPGGPARRGGSVRRIPAGGSGGLSHLDGPGGLSHVGGSGGLSHLDGPGGPGGICAAGVPHRDDGPDGVLVLHGAPSWPGPRADVRVTVSLATLLGLDEAPGDLAGHGPIDAVTARALAAGGTWRRIVTDPMSGAVLDVGRSRYRPPADLAAHVVARDRTCARPGCTVPAAACDLDHTVAYDDGGNTAVENLGPLCRRDHLLKTHAGHRLDQDGPGRFVWTSATGERYRSVPGDGGAHHRLRRARTADDPSSAARPARQPLASSAGQASAWSVAHSSEEWVGQLPERSSPAGRLGNPARSGPDPVQDGPIPY